MDRDPFGRTVVRAVLLFVPVTSALACAPRSADTSATAEVTRAMVVTRESSLWSLESADQLRLWERADHTVVGQLTIRERRSAQGLADSVAVFVDSMVRARFAALGCANPATLPRALTCVVRFRSGTPDWPASLRAIDAAMVADTPPDPIATALPNGMIRIRGCNDYCPRVTVEVRRGHSIQNRKLGDDAGRRLGRLIDSLQTIAEPATP